MRTYINILCVSVLLSLSMSCTDEILDEIDTNPNQVNNAPLNTLFPQTTMGFIRGVAGSGSVRLTSFIAEHHTNVLGMGGIYNTMTSYNSAAWNSGYSTLNDLKILRLKAQESQAWAYAGIADILSAYTYSNLVDIYGEIPFNKALQAGEIQQPKFDQIQNV